MKGKAGVFDNSIEHEAWNDGDEIRSILIFDILSARALRPWLAAGPSGHMASRRLTRRGAGEDNARPSWKGSSAG